MPTSSDRQPSLGNIEHSDFVLTDRGLEDAAFSPIQLFTIASPDGTATLIDTWTQLRNSKPKTELESPEWRALETAYMKHLEWRFDYPRKVLQQQFMFAWLITSLVVILVASGIVFSFFQLKKAMDAANLTDLKTEIAIQTAGSLSFSSTLVGAFVLIISLMFFYLYLRYVFSIKSTVPPHIALGETDAPKFFARKHHTNKRKMSGITSAESE
jgi:hypothetical protein